MTASMRVRPDAGGTVWRLRSLVAMGHSTNRLARALEVRPETVRRLVRGDAATVTPELRDMTCQLWDAWWDRRPPEQTERERRNACIARRRAERMNWCPPLGLDEDELDEPGYRPYSRYRTAVGAGIADDFLPATSSRSDASRGLHSRAAHVLPGWSTPPKDRGGEP
jgi:plasmid maintenance system antidote protein VapI